VGGKSEPVTPAKLLEDLALLAISVYLMLAPPGLWSVDRLLKKPDSAPPASPDPANPEEG
jgi:uncharacterized membrane protein YphA (DoxX/SURF4 family)